eukprot:4131654-Pleurochrysis_carterae.AAC.1
MIDSGRLRNASAERRMRRRAQRFTAETTQRLEAEMTQRSISEPTCSSTAFSVPVDVHACASLTAAKGKEGGR